MNDIERLQSHLARTFPDAQIRLTEPFQSGGVWWLDVEYGDKHLSIEWDAATGFGLTTSPADSYGERPDESCSTLEGALRRTEELLVSDAQTAPPLCVWLARLRERRGLTQQQLAAKLGVRQASVSGFERREDIQLSTLRKFVEALGGCLQVFALFPEGRFTLEDGRASAGFVERLEGGSVTDVAFSGKEMVSVLRGSAAWKLDIAGMLEQAVERAGKVKRSHALLEIP